MIWQRERETKRKRKRNRENEPEKKVKRNYPTYVLKHFKKKNCDATQIHIYCIQSSYRLFSQYHRLLSPFLFAPFLPYAKRTMAHTNPHAAHINPIQQYTWQWQCNAYVIMYTWEHFAFLARRAISSHLMQLNER